jgi:chemotaxis protein MotA
LGKGVASAFSATLYGVALSNLFLLPVAGKLRQRARDEWFTRTLLLEAILSIRSGEHPMLIEERLNAFLYSPEYGNMPRSAKAYASRPTSGLEESLEIAYDHSKIPDDFLQIGAED